jgi:alpha-ketoglutarate-dependent taurine dioxygenase
MHQKELNEAKLKKLRSIDRKSVSVSQAGLIRTGYLAPDQTLPLLVQPNVSDLELVIWAKSNLDFIETELLKHGAILFRDFKVYSESLFEQFAMTVAQLVNYVEGSSPRNMVSNKVYTSTEYPPEYSISMHNELSYAHKWPDKLFFFCRKAALRGGETPLADSRKVFELLDPKIRERFMQKGVKYVRNLHGGRGAGLSWQVVFETTDKSVVEDYCREGSLDFEWKEDGGLWTSQVRPAVATHPKTGQRVWFNQVDQWHPSNVGEDVSRALLATTKEEELPLNAYYGDGSPLETSVLDHIRAVYRQATITFPWQEGDILLLDNMLVAHGRMPFEGSRKVLVAMGMNVSRNESEQAK